MSEQQQQHHHHHQHQQKESRRPLSQYDNLSAQQPTSSVTGEPPKLPFKDIRFQFDDVPPPTTSSSPAGTKSVISDAKSIFFGLKPDSNSMPLSAERRDADAEDLPLMNEQEMSKATTPVANKCHNNSSTNNNNVVQTNGNGKKITLLVDDDADGDDDDDGRQSSSYLAASPSQAVYMSTTVPQNISKTNISGRHKPTRTSLRHSRMLVMGKFRGNRNQYALDIDCRLLARACYGTLLLSAFTICIICLGILLWAPNTPAKDHPYWSGIMLLLCGIITFAVTEFKKLPQNRLKENYFKFLQINCAILLIVTIFCCSLALVYNIIHLATLSTTNKECLPENLAIASKSCVCLFGDRRNFSRSELEPAIKLDHGDVANGEIRNLIRNETSWGFEIHYKDFTCDEVLGTWFNVILTLLVLNLLGLIASIVFTIIFVIGSKNRSRRNYMSVRMMQQEQQQA